MYSSSGNETQIQHKMHFHKTVQDLPIYNIHKKFETFDANKLRVEDIINAVFFNCDDKKHAQICAQTYICYRIINKATELKQTAIFYQDPVERSKTLYEEPAYILVKNGIANIAKNTLRHPAILLLKRCSVPSRKIRTKSKEIKQKKWKKAGKISAIDESLKSIVGKYPTLTIPKLSPKEIEHHTKTKCRIFDLKKSRRIKSLNTRKEVKLKKTENVKRSKANLIQNSEARRSSRLSVQKKKINLNISKKIPDNFSVVTKRSSQECQQFNTKFLKDKNLYVTTETNLQDCQYADTYFQNNELEQTKFHKNHTTFKMDNQLVEKNLQLDDKCYTETNFQERNDYFKSRRQIPEDLEDSYEVIDLTDDQINDEDIYIYDEQNVEVNNTFEFTASEDSNEDAIFGVSQSESIVHLEQKKIYEKVYSSTMHLGGNYTFSLVAETQMTITEDICVHLNDEFNLDKDVVESLRKLYKSVHDGRNNYIFCDLSY